MDPGSEALRTRLKEAGIKQAAVIDEAFDPPSLTAIAQEVAEFFTEVEASLEFRAELEQKGIPCGDHNEFEDEGWPKLWAERATLSPALTTRLRPLFQPHEQMLAEPEAVVQHLKNLELEEVHRVGANGNVPEGVPLVFLDYDLESGARDMMQQNATRLSQKIADELSKRDNTAPFLILFSNRPEVPDIADAFRGESGYLRGTFAFIAKENARDESKLRQLLFGYCLGHPALQLTQRFFFALKKHLGIVAQSVRQEVMQLDVQDYAFIQRLGLQEDGAPLGEYLLDLFGSVLSHEMRNGPVAK